MQNSIYTKFLFVCSLLFLFASCTKEDISTEQLQPELSQAEIYLNTHSVPAVLFSYNVLNTDTKVMNSFIIDDEGQFRSDTKQAFDIPENTVLSGGRLQALKDDAKPIDQNVSLDELVQNFNLMRTADRLQYDSSVEKEGPQMLTAVYAYYYDHGRSTTTTSEGDCGDGGSTTTTGGGSTGSYRAILLEQKLANDIIQKNPTAKFTIKWINELVNTSSIDLADN